MIFKLYDRKQVRYIKEAIYHNGKWYKDYTWYEVREPLDMECGRYRVYVIDDKPRNVNGSD